MKNADTRARRIVNAIRAKLNVDQLAAIISDRFDLRTGGPSRRSSELEARRNEYAKYGNETVDDDAGFACFLVFMESALAWRSLLNRSDSPYTLVIDEHGCKYRKEGKDVRVPQAYFISRSSEHSLLPWELAEAVYGAIFEALLDKSLDVDDDVTAKADGALRAVSIRFA